MIANDDTYTNHRLGPGRNIWRLLRCVSSTRPGSFPEDSTMKKLLCQPEDRYERLVIVAEAERYVSPGGKSSRRVVVKCDCGHAAIVRTNDLRSGRTTSCGCANRESAAETGRRSATHGMHNTSTYMTWKNMKARCMNPNVPHYIRYGGRGIRICEKWLTFEGFLADMGPCPSRMSIDRIDNSLGYFKDNCRWATVREQGRNKRSNRLVTSNGRTLCVSEWAEATGIPVTTIASRLKRGWSPERALMPKE